MTEEFTKLINPSVHAMTAFTKVYDDIIGSSQRYAGYATNNIVNSNPVVNVGTFEAIHVDGNVDKNVVDDIKVIGKQLANDRSFVTNMTGKISTNLTQDAYKCGFTRRIR